VPLARLLRAVRRVAGDLPLLLIGAAARDLLLSHVHGIELQRATEDTDLALAVPDWERFLNVREALSQRESSGLKDPHIASGGGINAWTSCPSAASSARTAASLGRRRALR